MVWVLITHKVTSLASAAPTHYADLHVWLSEEDRKWFLQPFAVLRGLTSLALPCSSHHGQHSSKQGLLLCSAMRFRWFQSSMLTWNNVTAHPWWRWRWSPGRVQRWKEAVGLWASSSRDRRLEFWQDTWVADRGAHVSGWGGKRRRLMWTVELTLIYGLSSPDRIRRRWGLFDCFYLFPQLGDHPRCS